MVDARHEFYGVAGGAAAVLLRVAEIRHLRGPGHDAAQPSDKRARGNA